MTRFLLPLLVAPALAFAQSPAPGSQPGQTGQPAQPQAVPSNRPIWRVNLPGGTYEILVGQIISVSSHEYVVDGAARVTEVNVDTGGQFAVRFYAIEPAVTSGPSGIGAATLGKLQGLATEAAERSGTDAWKKVVKSYPTTTHARTVEYRIGTREGLNRIFSSASKAFRTGKGDEISVND